MSNDSTAAQNKPDNDLATNRDGSLLDDKIKCRPFLKWVGGKTQLLPQLISRTPSSFNRYFEPFLGGAALYFALQPKLAYLSDLNAELINCYEVVRSNLEELKEELAKYRYEKEMFYQVRALDRSPDFATLPAVQRAARLIYLNKTCFNGLYRVNSKGYFNTPFGAYSSPKILDASNLAACSEVLQSAIIKSASFDEVAEIAEAGDFVYFDPPYAPLSDSADFTSYVQGGFDNSAQELLMLTCLKLHKKGVKWVASNSDTPFINELYRGFKIDIVSATRGINSNASLRGPITEVIISN